MTLNGDVLSAMIGQGVASARAGRAASRASAGLLDDAEAEIARAIARETGHQSRTARARARRAGEALGRQLGAEMEELANRRAASIVDRLRRDGVRLNPPDPVPGGLSFEGHRLGTHFANVASRAAERAETVVKAGGDATLATRGLRANARSVAASSANAAHNSAVLAVARANRKLVEGLMAVATLDDRTTAICERRHGGQWLLSTGRAMPDSATRESFPGRPPWHWNCRTVLTLLLFGGGDAEAPGDEWFSTLDAAETVGAGPIGLFRSGAITRSQMVSLDMDGERDDPEP